MIIQGFVLVNADPNACDIVVVMLESFSLYILLTVMYSDCDRGLGVQGKPGRDCN